MEFSHPPEGLFNLDGKEEVELPFFEDIGAIVYGIYYINTNFNFEYIKTLNR